MAEVTVAAGPFREVVGTHREVSAKITAPADASTWTTGLMSIYNVQCTFADSSTVAADSIATTVSGGTVTFEIAGTARDVFVVAAGY